MAPKREQILWESVWFLAEKLEEVCSLTSILSAGVVLFAKLSESQRAAAIRSAKKDKLEKLFQYVTLEESKMLTKFRAGQDENAIASAPKKQKRNRNPQKPVESA